MVVMPIITQTEVELLVRMHSRMRFSDPAVSKEDLEQEIRLALLVRSPESFQHGWTISRQVWIEFLRGKHALRQRSRLCSSKIATLQVSSEVDDLLQSLDMQEAVKKCSAFQKRVLAMLGEGYTPKEISIGAKVGLNSLNNSIRDAVNTIRACYGIPAGPFRLGRCRQVDLIPVFDRQCSECGADLTGRIASAVTCGDKCRSRRRERRRGLASGTDHSQPHGKATR